MDKKIIKAWGVHYPQVKNNLNSQGWYNGGNDKVQKTFEGLEITKSMYHQIPTSLLVESIISEDTPSKSVTVKKAMSKAEKVDKI